jgi:hypothetical protein
MRGRVGEERESYFLWGKGVGKRCILWMNVVMIRFEILNSNTVRRMHK